MSEWMIFAERIKAEMERQKLSYRQLADKMSITSTTMFRYAKGQRVPRASEILKAAEALGVTCDYLLGLSDDPHKTSTQPEIKPIDYQDCANAMLRMWMDKVVTDGEYNRIMDKLNAFWRTRNERPD